MFKGFQMTYCSFSGSLFDASMKEAQQNNFPFQKSFTNAIQKGYTT